MINAQYRRVGERRRAPMPLAHRERIIARLKDRAGSIETMLANGPGLLAGINRRLAMLEAPPK